MKKYHNRIYDMQQMNLSIASRRKMLSQEFISLSMYCNASVDWLITDRLAKEIT